MPDARAAHLARREALAASLQAQSGAAPLGLAKGTSNLFRDRNEDAKQRLDLHHFSNVIEVDARQGWVDVEGLCTYEDLVAGTLPHGVMPAVVPQLKTITIGGAAAGVGIEATSFRQGLVHDTLLEIDVLLPHGEIVTCTPDNERRDLFFGFPNSYGTLGYALRLRARVLPVKRFVRVEHTRARGAERFFELLAERCAGAADFVDGVVFNADEYVLNTGVFVDEAPWQSDYTFEQIYYKSLLEKEVDYLTAHDYIWRWDTDWFWCSKNLYAQNPVVRKLLGRERLNSRTYTRVMRFNSKWGFTRRLSRLRGRHPESVIQDVDIPLARAHEFLDFFLREVGVLPIWICPIGPAQHGPAFSLYPLTSQGLYVNFGFWDVVESKTAHEPGYFNKLIERKVLDLGGIKSLYSDCYFDRETFARAYALDRYEALKAKYDPQRRTLDLYEKCVLRA
ncbi:MAG TPA: FAD-binding oxidoreductase [Burkholderiaceae bacterium]|nr:FAD-binding oxidoreductase [Burkholderiaceae bacterium]